MVWCGLNLAMVECWFGSLLGVAACAMPEATWYELQYDLNMVATCSGLGGVREVKLITETNCL